MTGTIASLRPGKDMWQRLAGADKPIVLYGMGNGADKILEVFARKGIEAADFFASDGFVRGQVFHGKTVLSYAQVCEKYEDFIVIVSFGTRLQEVLETIYRIDSERELYVPDVPVAGGEIFDLDYFDAHIDELESAYELFGDEASRALFRDIISYRLTGRLGYLRRNLSTPDEVFTKLLSAADYRETADLGAYTGDSIRELSGFAPGLERITAFEPDERSFRKLCAYAEGAPFRIEAHNAAAWKDDCELTFTSGGNRNSTLSTSDALKAGAKLKTIRAARLDSLYSGRCDYIKYDVEGAEYEALNGSRETIGRCHPELLVSLYHRSEDIFNLPLMVSGLGYSRLYLRRYEYVPAWDLNLLAVK